MKLTVFFLIVQCAVLTVTAQVGIGTITPDVSAILDINSSDKGLLIPKVALNNTTNTMLDGVNTAATGLLIYNTNASVTWGEGVGFYYFNGTIWEKIGDDLGNHTATANLDLNNNALNNVNYVSTTAESNYDKLRVFNSSNYTIGMHSNMSYGFLNDWATTFTMLDTNIKFRGWLWRITSHAQDDGAMSLTTDGRLTLKSDLRVDTNTLSVDATNDRVGIGTITPSTTLEVNGKIKAIDVNFSGLPIYDNEADAITGGLTSGDMYKTSTGALRIKL